MLPGCLFLIGSWYRRHELLTRVAFFMTANDIAGSISGLLGAGLGSMDGIGGYSGWSWIFFIEGAITALAAVMAFFLILPFPEDSDFLPPEEKAWLLRRLHHDDKRGEVEKITTRAALKALMDWKVICASMLFLSVTITGYSITVFQPTILSTFGWSDLKSNLLSAPVRIAAGIVSVLFGIWSDKAKRRGPFCLFGFALSITGKLFVMLFTNGSLRYMGIYVASIGTYICQPLVLAWGVNQVVGNIKRGTLSSFAVCMGQVGGIISAIVFPKKDSPQYVPGLSTCVAFDVIGIICALSYWIYGAWENRQRDLGRRDYFRALPESEREKLGDRHPDFRYTV
ncbi:hypothetical protein VTN00DRAFT_5073 [Thermoascus crustaceus]|uniref:uncharacterized protein n=1 Tax=Thermoascus crustaceus TaxID=5088 RepID=UPI0037440D82